MSSVPEPAAASKLPTMARALRHRDFRLFFGGQLISLVGTWMQSVAQAWLVYHLTGSSVRLGLIGFAGQIPVFLLAPVGGAVADRVDRRRLIVATQVASMTLAFALAGLTLSGAVRVPHLFGLAALLGLVNAFDIPARQAFIADMVGRADLMNAIALNSSMVNGARIVGPAIAGLLVAAVGEGWCFFLNAVSYLAVLAGLLAMRPRPWVAPARVGSAVDQITEGFRFVARTGPIRTLLVLLGLVSMMGMPYSVLMPVFAKKVLHGGPDALGILMGAAGLGALAGALSLASRTGVSGLGSWVAWSSAGFGLSLILFASSDRFWLSVVLLVPVGFTIMVQMAASNTLIQAMVPDALRGRVMAVYSMMFMGMAPFGGLLAGVLADRIGAPRTVALGGVACVVGALVFQTRRARLHIEAHRLLIVQEMVGGAPAAEVSGSAVAAPSEARG